MAIAVRFRLSRAGEETNWQKIMLFASRSCSGVAFGAVDRDAQLPRCELWFRRLLARAWPGQSFKNRLTPIRRYDASFVGRVGSVIVVREQDAPFRFVKTEKRYHGALSLVGGKFSTALRTPTLCKRAGCT